MHWLLWCIVSGDNAEKAYGKIVNCIYLPHFYLILLFVTLGDIQHSNKYENLCKHPSWNYFNNLHPLFLPKSLPLFFLLHRQTYKIVRSSMIYLITYQITPAGVYPAFARTLQRQGNISSNSCSVFRAFIFFTLETTRNV